MKDQQNIRHIVILASPYSTLLDLSGPMDVFQKAIEHMDKMDHRVNFSYQIHIVSIGRSRQIPMSSELLAIVTEGTYKTINYPIDTLIVAGRSSHKEFLPDKACLQWLKEQSGKVRRVCSVCAGAFVLADAGILTDKKATTHWMLCDKMVATYPDITVNPEAIFVRDGNIYTSAGITSGMDLALALLEEDLGRKFALLIARIMVLFLKRPGNQKQYSTVLEAQKVDYKPISEVIEWINTHLNDDFTVERLADLVSMSPRNFARVFVRELGMTPMKYVEKVRLETACRYLTETNLTIDQVANHCGFRNSLNMNRNFMHVFSTTPSQYRKDFRTSF